MLRAEHRRLLAALAVAILHAGLFALLLMPVRLVPAPIVEALTVVNIPLPPPPPPVELPPDKPSAPAGPPAPKARPRPVVVPPPDVKIETPIVVPAAPAAADGTATASGAVSAGTGTGAAGSGAGAGAGGTGTGIGRVRPRWRSGRIERRDYPRSAAALGVGGRVVVHFDVDAGGRVLNCIIHRSSGNRALDETTCRLIEKRFRYYPALDANGQPMADIAGWQQDWWLDPPS